MNQSIPALPVIHLDDHGNASLQGALCQNCGAVFTGPRSTCASCSSRTAIVPMKLAEHGQLYTYTIVHRSYPGVKTPFVAAVIDLEGGGVLKGTLTDIDPKPEALPVGLKVKVEFRPTGQHDPQGKEFVSYVFVPAQGAA